MNLANFSTEPGLVFGKAVLVVILVLGCIWAAALLPAFIRSRLEGNPASSVGRFRRHLRVLEKASPAACSLASAPVSVSGLWDVPLRFMPAAWVNESRRLRLLRRRRNVAKMLLVCMVLTLLLGIMPGLRPILVLHGLFDVVFVIYAILLAKARATEIGHQMQADFDALREPPAKNGKHYGDATHELPAAGYQAL